MLEAHAHGLGSWSACVGGEREAIGEVPLLYSNLLLQSEIQLRVRSFTWHSEVVALRCGGGFAKPARQTESELVTPFMKI
mmetsp:Transcript_96455/g.243025  ORF Transcript_96455/g.243025 Transcript_96455/m.243025 type:complete len:80 (+) Transcript_96455:1064-1303(+)